MFTMFPIFFGLAFVLIFIIILTALIKGFSIWNKNNQQPRLNTQAHVVAKRMNFRSGSTMHTNEDSHSHIHSSSSTNYFITFEFESGDRLEFEVKDYVYGQVVEGDIGDLQFQGTRYLGFTRKTNLQKTVIE